MRIEANDPNAMKTPTIRAIAIGLTVALAATAAVGAAAPDKTPAADGTGIGPGSIGPDGGLPGPVPDFVGDIHETIDSFLDGSIENLGESLRDLRLSTAGAL